MEELRTATGLSQQQLADYIMIERARLGMFESGLRLLPTTAMQQLMDLFVLLPKDIKAKNLSLVVGELTTQSTKANEAVNRYRQKCQLQIQRKQTKLDKLVESYTQCLKLLQALRSLRQELPKNKINNYRLSWINVAELETLERLENCSLAKQQLLQMQINQLGLTM